MNRNEAPVDLTAGDDNDDDHHDGLGRRQRQRQQQQHNLHTQSLDSAGFQFAPSWTGPRSGLFVNPTTRSAVDFPLHDNNNNNNNNNGSNSTTFNHHHHSDIVVDGSNFPSLASLPSPVSLPPAKKGNRRFESASSVQSTVSSSTTTSLGSQNNKNKNNSTTTTTKFLEQGLHESDVICARDKFSNKHPGNLRYQALIRAHREAYQASKLNDEKSRLTRTVMSLVAERGGRFVKLNKTTSSWDEISSAAQHDKVSHALRSSTKENHEGGGG
eukprot:CAMPEP_0168844000 /NCGR_PEP_ID=MMETSP0727-20121128/8511_1 /TAXON_ID=265536 /ORGANISM="Amphiprora sp., Strain CCMP467" /LENGTH=270 /DNA_ID=CAMNT_0008897629 /DNA_START=96 /DNA_END=904 /DNA_ORIENTATION=+